MLLSIDVLYHLEFFNRLVSTALKIRKSLHNHKILFDIV
jgi:hypothetical protein